jgi:hypothetical protein
MGSSAALARNLFQHAYQILADNLAGLTLDEAIRVPEGGYRSTLGTLKHVAAWSHVYHSFAFEPQPRGWHDLDWPWGLRDRVDLSEAYLAAVVAWLGLSHERWLTSLAGIDDAQLDLPRPLHWGLSAPLAEIVVMVAGHHLYHAGEINQLLAISRGEAWEEGEEVEENHIATAGHRVKPAWQS